MIKIIISILLLLSITLNGYLAWQSRTQKEELNQSIINNRILLLNNLELERKVNGDSLPSFIPNH